VIKIHTTDNVILMKDDAGVFKCPVTDVNIACETGIWSLSFLAYPTDRGLAAARAGRAAFLDSNPGWPVEDHRELLRRAVPNLEGRIVP